MQSKLHFVVLMTAMVVLATFAPARAEVDGWLAWRGPHGLGVSDDKNLPRTFEIDGDNHRWTYDLPGRGTAVIAGDRVYSLGYTGEKETLHEVLVCLDAKTGKLIWKEQFNDFLSDIIYNRYSIGAPAVDPETGNVYVLTSPGMFIAFNPDGERLWEHSMMEEFGRLTFPNGRTGAPVVSDDLVITRGITSNWGANGPARDRFYGFDKKTGELVWTSEPGVGPRDSAFTWMHVTDYDGRKVLYTGTGCGNIVCINVKNGEPIWRFQLAVGGVNSAVLPYKDTIIAVHGKENLDTSRIGRMVAVKRDVDPKPGDARPIVQGKDKEVWRNDDISMFTGSPVLVGSKVYQVDAEGILHCVNADTGKQHWQLELGTSQIHASPLYANGVLYVPMVDGKLHIIDVTGGEPNILSSTQLEGVCLGAPAAWNGMLYVQTTEKLYAIGKPGAPTKPAANDQAPTTQPAPQIGNPVALKIVPSEVLLRPGDKQEFFVMPIDANGNPVAVAGKAMAPKWEKWIPPTAKVKVKMDADFDDNGVLVVPDDAQISAGAYKATVGELSGTIRGRVLPRLPINEGFESFNLTVPDDEGVKFSFPPLPWIGARFKWDIREVDGSKVFAKTLDNLLFQRSMVFVGHPDMSNYTVQADVKSDGNRRLMSNVGVINQRYIIQLKGNHQQLEVSSNHERLSVKAPFKWKAGTWYTMKTRVDLNSDGSGVVRAKVWPRDEDEPADWSIEVDHHAAHTNGAPGLFGFVPQNKHRVYIDNLSITPND